MLKNYLRFLALENFLYQATTLTLASITAFGQFLKMVITPSMLGQKKRMGTFLKVQNAILCRLHMVSRLETDA
jgi:hypothetical protein